MPRKLTREEFIEKATIKHGNKYNYSKVQYINIVTKVTIVCNVQDHGEFEQNPDNHLAGQGCPVCGKISRYNKKTYKPREEFKEKSKKVHCNKYDYSKVKYVSNKIKVTIICNVQDHGEFEQTPNDHLSGIGCPKCGGTKKLTIEEFIEKATIKHDNKYNYNKVEYINNETKVTIVCNVQDHGEFEQTPHSHLNQGSGCPKCGGTGKLTIEEFIEKATIKHDNKYNYNKVEYINNETKVTISCNVQDHGDFEQTPHSHLNQGSGCPKCGIIRCINSQKLTIEEFIAKAQKVHDNTYSYEKVDYKNCKTPILITCNVKDHGDFKQTPGDHFYGAGCPKCVKTRYSMKCIKFLNTFPFNIKHAENGGEAIVKIGDKKYKADGYIKCVNSEEVDTIFNCHEEVNKWRNITSLEVIIEFHGCFWHGCPKCYIDRDKINSVNNKTYNELYQNTCKKREDILNTGYNYIEIWECKYNIIFKNEYKAMH